MVFPQVWGQTAPVVIKQDSLITRALALKKEVNSETFANQLYRIQLYYGAYDQATEIMERVQESYPDLEASMNFETPNYKVQVGPFKNYVEALEQLTMLKEVFREAFLLEPKS
ncbi:MAG: SPOR domain-containing protein [Flavobacteriaceae bacterium]|jgi:tRNA(Ser,Leu) C12 N-acetylase TAN1